MLSFRSALLSFMLLFLSISYAPAKLNSNAGLSRQNPSFVVVSSDTSEPYYEDEDIKESLTEKELLELQAGKICESRFSDADLLSATQSKVRKFLKSKFGDQAPIEFKEFDYESGIESKENPEAIAKFKVRVSLKKKIYSFYVFWETEEILNVFLEPLWSTDSKIADSSTLSNYSLTCMISDSAVLTLEDFLGSTIYIASLAEEFEQPSIDTTCRRDHIHGAPGLFCEEIPKAKLK